MQSAIGQNIIGNLLMPCYRHYFIDVDKIIDEDSIRQQKIVMISNIAMMINFHFKNKVLSILK